MSQLRNRMPTRPDSQLSRVSHVSIESTGTRKSRSRSVSSLAKGKAVLSKAKPSPVVGVRFSAQTGIIVAIVVCVAIAIYFIVRYVLQKSKAAVAAGGATEHLKKISLEQNEIIKDLQSRLLATQTKLQQVQAHLTISKQGRQVEQTEKVGQDSRDSVDDEEEVVFSSDETDAADSGRTNSFSLSIESLLSGPMFSMAPPTPAANYRSCATIEEVSEDENEEEDEDRLDRELDEALRSVVQPEPDLASSASPSALSVPLVSSIPSVSSVPSSSPMPVASAALPTAQTSWASPEMEAKYAEEAQQTQAPEPPTTEEKKVLPEETEKLSLQFDDGVVETPKPAPAKRARGRKAKA